MEKKIFYEPSGNEFSVKCKIKGNLTDYQNGPVMWFQHLGIIGKDGTSVSHDSILPEKIKSAKLDETKSVNMSDWDQYVSAFGTKINPVSEKKGRQSQNSEFQFQQEGQKIKFKHIVPKQDGYYTCIYRVPCQKEFKIIGKYYK